MHARVRACMHACVPVSMDVGGVFMHALHRRNAGMYAHVHGGVLLAVHV
jgi:hypothetical protein